MTYKELLQNENWRFKRIEILKRDKNRCQSCFNERIIDTLQYGLLTYKDESNNRIVINIFSNKKIHGFCSKNALSRVSIKSIIAFDKNNNFIDIIGHRQLTESENNEYYLKNQADFIERVAKHPLFVFDVIKHSDFSKILDIPIEMETTLKKVVIPFSEMIWTDFKGLHIHHKYYQYNKLPWQYPNTALTTLCWSCHDELHENKKIPVHDDEGNIIGELTPCLRCHGAGEFPEYNNIQNGICFRCEGAQFEEFILRDNISWVRNVQP